MSVVADPNAAVNDLADRFWEGILERDPTWATLLDFETTLPSAVEELVRQQS